MGLGLLLGILLAVCLSLVRMNLAGHNSKAVHRAHARKAKVELPSPGEYERQRQMFAEGKLAEPVVQIANA